MAVRIEGQKPLSLVEAADRTLAKFFEHIDQIERGKIKSSVRYDANGNIIPTPSTRKSSVFDELNLSSDGEDNGGD